jgi:hypothetical protein
VRARRPIREGRSRLLGARDAQFIAVDLEKTNLLGAEPARMPRQASIPASILSAESPVSRVVSVTIASIRPPGKNAKNPKTGVWLRLTAKDRCCLQLAGRRLTQKVGNPA